MTDKKPNIIMVPTKSVIFVRDGERIMPPLNKGYRFTQDEIDTILKADEEALRKPTDESADAVVADDDDTAEDEAAAQKAAEAATKRKAENAKKPAPSKTDDDEGL